MSEPCLETPIRSIAHTNHHFQKVIYRVILKNVAMLVLEAIDPTISIGRNISILCKANNYIFLELFLDSCLICQERKKYKIISSSFYVWRKKFVSVKPIGAYKCALMLQQFFHLIFHDLSFAFVSHGKMMACFLRENNNSVLQLIRSTKVTISRQH